MSLYDAALAVVVVVGCLWLLGAVIGAAVVGWLWWRGRIRHRRWLRQNPKPTTLPSFADGVIPRGDHWK